MQKFSIITTTYKHQDFLSETIESVLSQSCQNWELLIGDDSPDKTSWEIIQKYVAKYPTKIKAWHHSNNKGIVANLNFLISKRDKKSKYISFLEGDDVYKENYLEKKLQIFSQYPEVGMVYNNLDFIDEKSKYLNKKYFRSENNIYKNQFLDIKTFILGDNFYGSYSSLAVRSDVLQEIGICSLNNEKGYLTSDWDLFGNIAHNYKIYGINESLTLYRRHSNNCSANMGSLISHLLLGIDNFIQKYDMIKDKPILYKIYELKTYMYFLKKSRLNTIKYGILSFQYSLKNNFLERGGMIIFSLLPNKMRDYLYAKLKK